MLGNKIHDLKGVEGQAGSCDGLGLLDIETSLQTEKCLRQVSGTLYPRQTAVAGYEIHMGTSSGTDCTRPMMRLDGRDDGARSEDDLIMGTYLHGLFDVPEACDAILDWAGCKQRNAVDLNQLREQGINQIADALEQFFNFTALETALNNVCHSNG